MPLPDYTPKVWQQYPSTATLLDAADLNDIEQNLADASASAHAALNQTGGPTIIAPAPSGGDDTTALQTLLTQAQNTGGTLVLRAGTYRANLTTAQSFNQPRIIGQGKNYTTLQGFVNTSPVLRFKGGSGEFSGGLVSDLTITGTGGIGLQYADVTGARWTRIEIGGTLAVGLEFWNESTAGFTEFCHGDVEIASTVILPVHYRRTGGSESFHGTGLTHGTQLTQRTGMTTPLIQIDQGCFPYNAPLSVSFYAVTTTPLIRHLNTGASRMAQFFGHITAEAKPGNNGAVIVDPAQVPVLYSGNVTLLGATGFTHGELRLNDLVYYNDAGIYLWHKVTRVSAPVSSTSPGDPGWIAMDANWFYFVVGQDQWRRVPAQTF